MKEAEKVLSDKNIKSTAFLGTNGNKVLITSPCKMEVVSYTKLEESFKPKQMAELAPTKTEVKRTLDKDFAAVMASIVTGNFIEDDLETFIWNTFKTNTSTAQIPA